jgi:hypothetical protein
MSESSTHNEEGGLLPDPVLDSSAEEGPANPTAEQADGRKAEEKEDNSTLETETTLTFTPGSHQYFENFRAFGWTWYGSRACLFRIFPASLCLCCFVPGMFSRDPVITTIPILKHSFSTPRFLHSSA